MLKLQFADGSRESIWLVDSVYKIGSDPSNNLVIKSADMQPFHAEIVLLNDELSVKNLNPEFVVGVNDKRVASRQILQINDVVSLGQTRLKVITPASETKAKPANKASQESDWALEIHASWAKQSLFPIKENAIIGRDETCDITVPVSHLSRQHARLTPSGNFLLVKDLESTNGTFLNGERITQGRAKPGDKLRFDVVTFAVVGPASDENKTIVRRAPATSAATNSAAAPQTKPAAPVVKATQKKAPVAATAQKPPQVANSKPAASPHIPPTQKDVAEKRAGKTGKMALIAGICVIIAVVAGILLVTI